MRIIAGQNRGQKLATPKGHEVRPILDRVRESLFGILRDDVAGVRVADLFAGTGVIGLEALSRGAEFCTFIERDHACVATIGENIRRTRRESETRVVHGDAFRAAEVVAEGGACGLIFVDPPYRLMRSRRNFEKVEELVTRLGEPDILGDGGLVVLRCPAEVDVPGHLGCLVQVDRRRYGGMKLAFSRRGGVAKARGAGLSF